MELSTGENLLKFNVSENLFNLRLVVGMAGAGEYSEIIFYEISDS